MLFYLRLTCELFLELSLNGGKSCESRRGSCGCRESFLDLNQPNHSYMLPLFP